MTEAEKIVAVKSMIGTDTDSEDVLSTYLKIAGSKILAKAYPYETDVTEVPAKYEYLQIEIAVYLLNKRGAEGEVTHTENSITRQYENGDVPDSMLSNVVPHCGVFS